MGDSARFGGEWTVEKLDIIFKYLNFYTTALKNTRFKKIYVDGFAGEGVITLNDGRIINGSAAMSLNVDNPFDEYYFVEIDKRKIAKLTDLKTSNPTKNITVIQNDANKALCDISDSINPINTRGVFFVDPFATQTNWKTIESVAKTKCADMWFLFPFVAVNRLLARDRGQTKLWSNRLNLCFGGENWKDAVYKQKECVQLSLFEGEKYEDDYEKVDVNSIIEYIKQKFETVFPYVAPNPRIFRNNKNSIIFILFFMTANPSPKAIGLASKCAEFILGKKK